MGSVDVEDRYSESNELDQSESDFNIGRSYNIHGKKGDKRGVSVSSRHEFDHADGKKLTINLS